VEGTSALPRQNCSASSPASSVTETTVVPLKYSVKVKAKVIQQWLISAFIQFIQKGKRAVWCWGGTFAPWGFHSSRALTETNKTGPGERFGAGGGGNGYSVTTARSRLPAWVRSNSKSAGLKILPIPVLQHLFGQLLMWEEEKPSRKWP